MTLHAQLSLLRLVSPALPVGAFAYSRGLEPAVAAGWVHDELSAGDFILGLLEHALCPLDGAVLCRLHAACLADDAVAVRRWDRFLRAGRESAELLQEDVQMGRALARLLQSLGRYPEWLAGEVPGFTCTFALAATRWGIGQRDALAGFFYATTESQVSAALRLLPLGQTAGQRILERALPVIERCVEAATALTDDDIGNFCPGLSLASAWHETQYSRLFRS
jgi:urease accessory protein